MKACRAGRCVAAVYALGLCRGHYDKDYRLRVLRGEMRRIDIAPVVGHLTTLRSRGFSWEMIDGRARIAQETLQQIRAGTLTELPAAKARRIFTIEPTWQHTTVPVPSAGTRRRRSALAWQGWSAREICREIDLSVWALTQMKERVTARTAAMVAEFYDDRIMAPGPNPTYAAWARTRGALPWGAWDEDTIDDPAAKPLRQRQWRRRHDTLVPRIEPEELAFLVDGGRSLESIATDFGFTVAALKESLTAYRTRQRRQREAA